MALLIIIFGLTTMMLNFYVSYLYMNLNRTGIITNYKRVSWKILKTNLVKIDNLLERKEIEKCFKVYKLFLLFLYAEILFILIKLFLSAGV